MKTLKTTQKTRMIAMLFLVSITFGVAMTGKVGKGRDSGKSTTINGLPVDKLMGTAEVLQANPDLAKFQFRVTNKWLNGGHNRSFIKDFYGAGIEDKSRKRAFVYDNGEPPVLLGENEGANPVEYILHGLAGCLTTTLVLHAAAHGIELKSVESRLEGDMDMRGFLGLSDEVRKGYEQIKVTFSIEGDLTEGQKAQLESFVMMSPVFDIITNQTPVQVALTY